MKTRNNVVRRIARGFTLLEMMLVVMIMGVLIGVAAWMEHTFICYKCRSFKQ